jgi:hypothetical protein
VTCTCVDAEPVPPSPVQVRVNVADALSADDACEPEVASMPLQPSDAVQPVASVLLQVRVTVPPLFTVPTLEVNVTVGAGGAATRLKPYRPYC